MKLIHPFNSISTIIQALFTIYNLKHDITLEAHELRTHTHHANYTPFSTKLIPPLQIHKAKAEKARERILKEEMDAKRAKTKAARERRQERVVSKRNAQLGEEEEPVKE